MKSMEVAARPSGLIVKIGRGSTRSRRLDCSRAMLRCEVGTDSSQTHDMNVALVRFHVDMRCGRVLEGVKAGRITKHRVAACMSALGHDVDDDGAQVVAAGAGPARPCVEGRQPT
jgi:hypothetical protein